MKSLITELLSENPELKKEELEEILLSLRDLAPKEEISKDFRESVKKRIEAKIAAENLSEKRNFVFLIPAFSFLFIIGIFSWFYSGIISPTEKGQFESLQESIFIPEKSGKNGMKSSVGNIQKKNIGVGQGQQEQKMEEKVIPESQKQNSLERIGEKNGKIPVLQNSSYQKKTIGIQEETTEKTQFSSTKEGKDADNSSSYSSQRGENESTLDTEIQTRALPVEKIQVRQTEMDTIMTPGYPESTQETPVGGQDFNADNSVEPMMMDAMTMPSTMGSQSEKNDQNKQEIKTFSEFCTEQGGRIIHISGEKICKVNQQICQEKNYEDGNCVFQGQK